MFWSESGPRGSQGKRSGGSRRIAWDGVEVLPLGSLSWGWVGCRPCTDGEGLSRPPGVTEVGLCFGCSEPLKDHSGISSLVSNYLVTSDTLSQCPFDVTVSTSFLRMVPLTLSMLLTVSYFLVSSQPDLALVLNQVQQLGWTICNNVLQLVGKSSVPALQLVEYLVLQDEISGAAVLTV